MPGCRCGIGSDTWHWRKDCSKWPKGRAEIDYDVRHTRPTRGEFDNAWLSKDGRGNCRK